MSRVVAAALAATAALPLAGFAPAELARRAAAREPTPGATRQPTIELGAVRLSLPAGFVELPALAATTGDGVARRGAGDPASGCYALLQAEVVDADVDPIAIDAAIQAALARAALGPAAVAPTATAARAAVGTALRGRGVEGTIATELVGPADGDERTVVSLACFHDDREPAYCARRCDALRAGLAVRP